jgi:hypothetical protein
MNLTPRQIQILRWLDENPSNRARWVVNGREPKGSEGPDKWTHMEISGPAGSIMVAVADNKALQGLYDGCPTPDKIYGLNDAGRAALADSIEPQVSAAHGNEDSKAVS